MAATQKINQLNKKHHFSSNSSHLILFSDQNILYKGESSADRTNLIFKINHSKIIRVKANRRTLN